MGESISYNGESVSYNGESVSSDKLACEWLKNKNWVLQESRDLLWQELITLFSKYVE